MNGMIKHMLKLGLVVMLTLMLWAPGAVLAADPSQDEAGAVHVEFPKVSVTIASKSPESVTTNTGDRFAVSKQTIIVGLDGRQVTIRKFMVPCDAVVTYSSSRESSYPLAQMIRVKSVSSDADWRYKAISPQ